MGAEKGLRDCGGWRAEACVLPRSGEESNGLQLRLVIERKLEQRMTALEVEFLANAGAMVFDGAVTDEEFRPDLFAGFVLCNQFQDAEAVARAMHARAQRPSSWASRCRARQRRVDVRSIMPAPLRHPLLRQ